MARKGAYLLCLIHGISAFVFAFAIPDHIGDPSWPAHARNHVFQSLIWLEGLHGLSIAVGLLALLRGERWAWYAMAASGAVLFGGYFVPVWTTSGGAPGAADDVLFGVLAAAYAAGLVMSRGLLEASPAGS